jgi:ABC-2 type transport system ATP-binding protein
MDTLVQTHRLCKRYSDTMALVDLDLSVGSGEIVGLLGPNGAGKTTAIQILLGLLRPTSGEAHVFGRSPENERPLIAPQLNFSSAYAQLPSNLKVIENLRVFAHLYCVPNAAKKIQEVTKLLSLEGFIGRLTGALSSGEKTRLNLAKALLNDPKLLLLDEPTASLDPEMADTVRTILMRLRKERGIGILYTSHNMPEVEALCDRIHFIHEGRTIAAGSPKEVLDAFRSPSLEKLFIQIVRSGDFVAEKK